MSVARWVNLKSIVLVFVMLAVIYSITTPIFEAPDEVSHYAMIQHIADTGELPVQRPGVKTAWEQEGSQPPLYYLLVFSVARAIDTHDAADRMYHNPHAAPGDPSLDANRNLIIHSAAEDFPWRNTTLAVHLIRFISIALGAVTVAIGYVLARRIFPEHPSVATGAALLIAFNPMFLFITATVNNDNLATVLASLALYLGVVCWQEPPGRIDRSGWGRRLVLGLVLGGAALSKLSGLTLLPVVAVMLTIRHLRERDWRGWVLSGLLIAVPVLLIAGWWYLRNVQLYGELFGLNTMVAIVGSRSKSLLDLILEFDGFRYSYWALFGAVNIVTFPLAYVIFDLFTLLAVIGCGLWFVRNRRSDQFWLIVILAGYVLLVFIGLIRWTMMTPASQGRLMFPAISSISLLLWLGWETILSFRFRNFEFSRLRWAMPIFLLFIAVLSPFRDIAPTYAGPEMISEQQLPSDLKRLEVDYGDQLQLVGYRSVEQPSSTDVAAFTLYWQCLQPIPTDYSIFAIVYGRQLQEVGKRDAYPYHGLFATRLCQPGQIFADPYKIPIKTAEADRPTVLRAQIGVKDRKSNRELAPSANGAAIPAVMLPVGKLVDTQQSKPEHTMNYRWGDSITLLDASVDRSGSGPSLSTTWHVTAPLPDAYTIFVHVLDAHGNLIGQADGQPLGGDYPTDWWSPGETIVDTRPLPLPPEADRVTIGLYRLSDQTRLSVVDEAGRRVSNDEIVLAVQP